MKCSLLMLLLCGLLYPFMVTMTASMLFPIQATGSLIERNGRVIGSELIGQPFVRDDYFHSRPSAVRYDPLVSAGSNLGPSNPDLRRRVSDESTRIQKLEGVSTEDIPVDRLATSGSGLDPHISVKSARMQIRRIAKAGGLDQGIVRRLVADHIEGPQFGFLGQSRINVLRLNQALDRIQTREAQPGPTRNDR
ncbi:MAG: potassium-transporting ATPase subunit KdpC [Gammaproteobacteria bacterium]